MENMQIRSAVESDTGILSEMERICFSPAEAASESRIRDRIRHFGEHYLILSVNGKHTAYLDAMPSDEEKLRDEMYHDASLTQPDGKWLMVFGLGCLPEFRNRGFGGKLLRTMQHMAVQEGRRGMVLTCKEFMIPYYTRFGFVDEGLSESEHGGAAWNSMRWTAENGRAQNDGQAALRGQDGWKENG